MLIKSRISADASIPKVNGRKRATPMEALSPGMEPMSIPTAEPPSIAIIAAGVKTLASADNNISIFFPLFE